VAPTPPGSICPDPAKPGRGPATASAAAAIVDAPSQRSASGAQRLTRSSQPFARCAQRPSRSSRPFARRAQRGLGPRDRLRDARNAVLGPRDRLRDARNALRGPRNRLRDARNALRGPRNVCEMRATPCVALATVCEMRATPCSTRANVRAVRNPPFASCPHARRTDVVRCWHHRDGLQRCVGRCCWPPDQNSGLDPRSGAFPYRHNRPAGSCRFTTDARPVPGNRPAFHTNAHIPVVEPASRPRATWFAAPAWPAELRDKRCPRPSPASGTVTPHCHTLRDTAGPAAGLRAHLTNRGEHERSKDPGRGRGSWGNWQGPC
jgi:hypothetical protein